MPLNERDYAKKPLPGEEIRPGKSKISAEGLEDYELTMTADGFRVEKRKHVDLNWWDVLFWVVVLLAVRGCAG